MSNPDAVSIDSIIQAMYESISGKAGEPRQWARDRALHHPKALLVPTRQAPGGPAAGVFDFDGFVASRAPYLDATDFYEIEVGRRVPFRRDRARPVFYEARATPEGGLLRGGVNSIQLLHDGERWWFCRPCGTTSVGTVAAGATRVGCPTLRPWTSRRPRFGGRGRAPRPRPPAYPWVRRPRLAKSTIRRRV